MTPRIDPAGARGPARVQRFAHDAMACTFELFVVAADRGYAGQAARAAFDEVDRLEGELSRFRPGGDVARIALLSRGESLRVSHEVLECLQLAARVQMETGGAFDVTFRAAPGPGEPREEGPAGRLEIDPRNLTVTARRDHVPVDLGGIGKGAALDRIGEILGEWGLEAALLHAGRSTVLARGAPPAGTGWSVALRRPRWGGEGGEAGDALPGVVTLRDRALAGSGRDLHGEHILDPRTGAPPPRPRAGRSRPGPPPPRPRSPMPCPPPSSSSTRTRSAPTAPHTPRSPPASCGKARPPRSPVPRPSARTSPL